MSWNTFLHGPVIERRLVASLMLPGAFGSGFAWNGLPHSAEACSHNFDGATCLQELELSATVDALDRLHGTYTYRHVYDDGRVYTATTAANLAGVVRWP